MDAVDPTNVRTGEGLARDWRSAAGRVLSPLTARGQLVGGMIWCIGSVVYEETGRDGTAYRNVDLAEYLVPAAADTGAIEAPMLPDLDGTADPLKPKGLGEPGIIGVDAAIANAVYNATGRHIRRLPIRIAAMLRG